MLLPAPSDYGYHGLRLGSRGREPKTEARESAYIFVKTFVKHCENLRENIVDI